MLQYEQFTKISSLKFKQENSKHQINILSPEHPKYLECCGHLRIIYQQNEIALLADLKTTKIMYKLTFNIIYI